MVNTAVEGGEEEIQANETVVVTEKQTVEIVERVLLETEDVALQESPHSIAEAAKAEEEIEKATEREETEFIDVAVRRRIVTEPLANTGESGNLQVPYAESPLRNSTNSATTTDGKRKSSMRQSQTQRAIGTQVNESHRNYMLMYDMLTGIRISVKRAHEKPQRDLTDDDYAAAHKIAFDISGNEMVPTSKYDFKFKDYSPLVFREIRRCFFIEALDYLTSLTGKYVLSELGSPGKSGSFFYYSADFRFIIKTIHRNEHRFLRKILPSYCNYVRDNPNTLVSRILGLHRVKLPGNRKIHFVVMGNVFPPNRDMHEIFDLKGSSVGRRTADKDVEKNPSAVQKDLNWIEKNKKLLLGPQKKTEFLSQLAKDVEFLKEQKIMDYSLLIGIHDLRKQPKKEKNLSLFEPDRNIIQRAIEETQQTKKRASKANVLKRMWTEYDYEFDRGDTIYEEYSILRCHVPFYKYLGGYQATDSQDCGLSVVYYVGIIDILTKYDATKKTEHFFKSLLGGRNEISAVRPKFYGQRFFEFVQNAIGNQTRDEQQQVQEEMSVVP